MWLCRGTSLPGGMRVRIVWAQARHHLETSAHRVDQIAVIEFLRLLSGSSVESS